MIAAARALWADFLHEVRILRLSYQAMWHFERGQFDLAEDAHVSMMLAISARSPAQRARMGRA